MASDDGGLDEKLLNAIPPARRILEVGCADGRLGQRYKELHPGANWTGIDGDDDALAIARARLDRALRVDPDSDPLDQLGTDFDAVVIASAPGHLQHLDSWLARLKPLVRSDARLVCSVSAVSDVSAPERLLIGDFSYDAEALSDGAHLRIFSPSSIYKTLLDAGWLPTLANHHAVAQGNGNLGQHLVSAGAGIPKTTAEKTIYLYQLILECAPIPATTAREPVSLSVIVPVNNRPQFDWNVVKSPGLEEIGAEIIDIKEAPSAAAAFEAGAARAAGQWLLFCHQDVYFPKGSGWALSDYLHRLPRDRAKDELVGFAGLGVNELTNLTTPAGLVIDRLRRFDHPGSERAISLDEFAVLMNRESRHKLDPALGWHLWATDLCLRAAFSASPHCARIARIPLFHNSLSDHTLPDAFHKSAAVLKAKYSAMPVIPTLCGNIK